MSHLNKDSISIWVKKLKGFLVNHNLLAINPKRSQFEIFWRCLCYKWYFETWNWAIVSMGKCLLLFEQISFGQMSKWAKYFWANYFGQMSRGKCRLRNGLSTIFSKAVKVVNVMVRHGPWWSSSRRWRNARNGRGVVELVEFTEVMWRSWGVRIRKSPNWSV